MCCNKIKKSWLKLKVRVTAPSYANFIFLLNVNQYFNRPQEGKTPQNIQHTETRSCVLVQTTVVRQQ